MIQELWINIHQNEPRDMDETFMKMFKEVMRGIDENPYKNESRGNNVCKYLLMRISSIFHITYFNILSNLKIIFYGLSNSIDFFFTWVMGGCPSYPFSGPGLIYIYI